MTSKLVSMTLETKFYHGTNFYVINMVIWLNLGKSSTNMREAIITLVSPGFLFFEVWSSFKFNNFELPISAPWYFVPVSQKGLNKKSVSFEG